MSNAFTNFLGGVVNGVFGEQPLVRDAQHANRLYVRETYARAPKFGFLYFVNFNINLDAVPTDSEWASSKKYDAVGLLVKRVDLPKFSIQTETANQYNRRIPIQTHIKYNDLTIDFHDDNSNITRDLWKTYYQYYFSDSVKIKIDDELTCYDDNKYKPYAYEYGLNHTQTVNFFRSIDVYILHQQKFTQYTLMNPTIKEWSHDVLDQAQGDKVLTNKLTVAYEAVAYNQGNIVADAKSGRFSAIYYDKTPSPLSVSGNGSNTIFGSGGIIAGASSVLGQLGKSNYLGAAIQAVTLGKNIKQLNKAGLKSEGYSILTGALGNLQVTGNQPGGIGSEIQAGRGNGINFFSQQNSSINGTTATKPSNLTTK